MGRTKRGESTVKNEKSERGAEGQDDWTELSSKRLLPPISSGGDGMQWLISNALERQHGSFSGGSPFL